MDFARSSKADELLGQLATFLAERVIPAEAAAVAERQSAPPLFVGFADEASRAIR